MRGVSGTAELLQAAVRSRAAGTFGPEQERVVEDVGAGDLCHHGEGAEGVVCWTGIRLAGVRLD